MLDFSKLLGTSVNKQRSLPGDQSTNNQEQDVKTMLDNNGVTDFNKSQMDSSNMTNPNSQATPPVGQYFKSVNDGLNKLSGYKGTFTPVQKKKIAQLYQNARNKYNTSSKSDEETAAFNEIKANPIWGMFKQ